MNESSQTYKDTKYFVYLIQIDHWANFSKSKDKHVCTLPCPLPEDPFGFSGHLVCLGPF